MMQWPFLELGGKAVFESVVVQSARADTAVVVLGGWLCEVSA